MPSRFKLQNLQCSLIIHNDPRGEGGKVRNSLDMKVCLILPLGILFAKDVPMANMHSHLQFLFHDGNFINAGEQVSFSQNLVVTTEYSFESCVSKHQKMKTNTALAEIVLVIGCLATMLIGNSESSCSDRTIFQKLNFSVYLWHSQE